MTAQPTDLHFSSEGDFQDWLASAEPSAVAAKNEVKERMALGANWRVIVPDMPDRALKLSGDLPEVMRPADLGDDQLVPFPFQ